MSLDQISSFLQVVLVDLVLAGDNAIVVGMVAATVAADQRRQPTRSPSSGPTSTTVKMGPANAIPTAWASGMYLIAPMKQTEVTTTSATRVHWLRQCRTRIVRQPPSQGMRQSKITPEAMERNAIVSPTE